MEAVAITSALKSFNELGEMTKEAWYKDQPLDKSVFYDLNKLDQPHYFKEPIQLTDLNDETKQELENKGYGNKTIDSIGSEEEADIYAEANLEPQEVNGRECLIRTDIDYDQVDDKGRTNLERMEKGLSPLDKDGQPYELHHIGQKMDAPLAELTKKEHISDGNYNVLHESKESEISRSEFNKERADHWKARAGEIKQELNNQ